MATGWAPGRVGLYRLYDADLTLLYAGIGEFPEVRWKAHSKRATWWPEVDLRRSIIVWFDCRTDAEVAEIAVIQTEDPVHNVTYSLRFARTETEEGPGSGSDMRRLQQVDDDLWKAYGAAVGMRKRSTDLKAYMEWRVNNPDVKLPGSKLLASRPARRPRSSAA